MAIASPERITHRLEELWRERRGLAGVLSTVDHKAIGRRYIYTASVLFAAAGFQAMLVRAQLARPDERLVAPQTFNELFTMHGVTMIFFFVTPMMSGFGNYLIPLMVGTRDMAFPRLNAFGYWVYLFAALFLYSSYLTGHPPDDGWFNYPPLANKTFTPGLNIDYYTIGLTFLSISTTVGAFNFIVTIFKLRAPGMALSRIPLFAWGVLATSFSIVFALPSLTAASVMLELDRRAGFTFFDPAKGGDVVLWQHLFWIFGHPDVYIIVLPGLGMLSTIIPVFARRRAIGYVWLALSLMITAIIGFGVWVHHMFAAGLPSSALAYFSAASLVITVPSGVQMFLLTSTIVAGRPWLATPMLYAMAAIVTFVIGGVTGVMFGVVSFDQQVTDSYFVVAHFHYTLFGGAVFPLLAAFHYWVPKIWGRLMDERLGKLGFWLTFAGFNLTFFPMHVAGLLGMPRRVWTYQSGLGWDVWNLMATIGGILLGVGFVVVAANFLRTIRHGRPAGPNPWNGPDLEWATTSPPPHYNFAQIPVVRSRDPLWDQPELRDLRSIPEPRLALAEGHDTLGTTVVDAEPEALLPMPEETYAPVVTAAGLAVISIGVLGLTPPVIVLGGAVALGGILAWVRPTELVG